DGEFYLPSGYAHSAPDGLHIILERLPGQGRQEEAGISGPVCTYFQRIAAPVVDAGRETSQTQEESPPLPDWHVQSGLLSIEGRPTLHEMATTGIGLAINDLTAAPWSQATLWAAARNLGNLELPPPLPLPQGQNLYTSDERRARTLFTRLGYPLETGSGNDYSRG
ncbi:MAG: hypothetical protein ACM3PY_02300, partial [Omnitrophica WOR_2 bacterium]